MLAKRVIPCLDVHAGRVVKGTKFPQPAGCGGPMAVAARYETEGADELVFLDITASHEDRGIILDVVRRTAEQVFMPLTVGAGTDDRRYSEFVECRLRQSLDQFFGLQGPGLGIAGGRPVRIPVYCRQYRSETGSS